MDAHDLEDAEDVRFRHTLRQTRFEKRLLRQDGTGFVLLERVALTRGGSDGPGAAVTTRGEIMVVDSKVQQNLSEEPGGGIMSQRRATIVRSVITGNLASDDGGGVYARRGGVQVYDSIVNANLAQAQDRWGRERADTIVNNHRAKIIGAGVSDTRTLEAMGRLLGDQQVSQESSTEGDGRSSTTRSTTWRSLAPPNVLRESAAGSAVLIYGTLPPARIRLRPWFANRRLQRLAAERGPGVG